MEIYSAIILCFIPLITTVILIKILVKEIKIAKELLACLLGIVSLLPIVFFQYLFGKFNALNAYTLLLRAILLYGLIEEGIKGAVLFLFPTKKVSLKEFFLYGIISGMILGCFESVVYLNNSIQIAQQKSGEVLLHLIYVRTFTSMAVHTLCSGLLSIFVYSVKKKKIMISSLIYAILLHGLYDFFAIMPGVLNIFSYVMILFIALECRINYIKLQNAL